MPLPARAKALTVRGSKTNPPPPQTAKETDRDHHPHPDLRVSGRSEPLSWRIGTDMPGIVIDERRLALEAVHDLTDVVDVTLWDYTYRASRNSATGMKRSRVVEPDLLGIVRELVNEVGAELRRLLAPTAAQVTEIVVDGLPGSRQSQLVAYLLRREFREAGTQVVTSVDTHVLVTGSPDDEERVIRALVDACVPCSVHAHRNAGPHRTVARDRAAARRSERLTTAPPPSHRTEPSH